MNPGKTFYAVIALALLFTGCSRYSIDPPEGFAYQTEGGVFTAYSPEGVKLSVRHVKNQPEKTPEFWTEAVKSRLEREGNILVLESDFTVDNGKGSSFKWLMPYGEEYYYYVTAVAVNRKTIIIAEAAGEKKLFEKYEEAINRSLSSVVLK